MSEYLSNKFRWLSLVATWSVVGIHSRTVGDATGQVDYVACIQATFTDLFRFAVPLFFVISGFLFVGSYERYGWMPLLRRKIKSLYAPMVLWGGIGLIMILPIRMWIHGDIPTVADFLKLPLMALAAGGGHFWYVRILIIMFAMAPIVYYIARRSWAVVLCFTGALLIPEGSAAANLHVPVAIIFTFLGTQLAILGQGNITSKKRSGVLFVICLAGLVLSFVFRTRLTTHYFLVLFEPLFMIGVVWFGYDALDNIHSIGKFPEKLSVLFIVYCMHIIVLQYCRCVLRLILGTSPLMSLARYFVLCQTFWLDIILANILRKTCPRIFAILAGGR